MIFWSVLVGPAMGGIVIALMMGKPEINDPNILWLFVFSYFIGAVPAIMGALVNCSLLACYKRRSEQLDSVVAVYLEGIAAFIVAMVLIVTMGVGPQDRERSYYIGYFAVFIIPGAVCGLINKVAWRYL